MAMFRWWIGLTMVIGLSGLSAGEPPIRPLVEGRELDPVAREFHFDPAPSVGSAAGLPGCPENPEGIGHLIFPVIVCDVFMSQMTFPLGSAGSPAAPIGV
jgi:hypothetical protein